MQVVYAHQPFPDEWTKSIFLAGPTPRGPGEASWRSEALEALREASYDGVVFVPEPPDGNWRDDYSGQVQWEGHGLALADVILFWVPRDLETMPGFTTNVEFGRWVDSHKVVLGHPADAPKTRYLDEVYASVAPGETPPSTLEEAVARATTRLGDGVLRKGGERGVPLHMWSTPFFQAWYRDLRAAGNRLDDARVRWVFYLPKIKRVLAGVLWVSVWVEAEQRHKSNEWIFGRTDIISVVLCRRPRSGVYRLESLLDLEVVLIREFRSPARTTDGFVHELPGGSGANPDRDPREVAAAEVNEETGLTLQPDRFTSVESRQAAATVSTHHVHLLVATLDAKEMKRARRMAENKQVHGNVEETERTVLEMTTVRELLESTLVDWSTIGMVMKALHRFGEGRRKT